MQLWMALHSDIEHSCSISQRRHARPTLLLKKRAVPSTNHDAFFPTARTSCPAGLLHYCYYYCRYCISILWRSYYLNGLLIMPMLYLSDRNSQFRIKATFVIFNLQRTFHIKCIYMFMIYPNVKFHNLKLVVH